MIKRTYDLEDRLIDFVLKIDQIVELLPNTRLANHLAVQLIRSGTSPALNYEELIAIFAKSSQTAKSKLPK